MMNLLRRLWNEEEGQGMVEYGLIIALVAIVVVVGLTTLGGTETTGLKGFFKKIGDWVTTKSNQVPTN